MALSAKNLAVAVLLFCRAASALAASPTPDSTTNTLRVRIIADYLMVVGVSINDRGPFVHGRSLDLSKRAAEKIGIIHKGVARVKVTRVDSDAASDEPASPPPVSTPAAPVAMPAAQN